MLLLSVCSRIAIESASLSRSARLADALKIWLQESSLRSLNEHSLLQHPAIKQLADSQIEEEIAARSTSPDPSAAAPSSSSAAPATATAASCVRAALDYLLQMGLILKTSANSAGEATYERQSHIFSWSACARHAPCFHPSPLMLTACCLLSFCFGSVTSMERHIAPLVFSTIGQCSSQAEGKWLQWP